MNKTIAIFIFFTLLLTMVGFSDVQLRDKKSKDDKSQVVRQKRDCVVKYSKMEFYGVYNDRSQIYFNANVGCAKVIPTSLSLTNMNVIMNLEGKEFFNIKSPQATYSTFSDKIIIGNNISAFSSRFIKRPKLLYIDIDQQVVRGVSGIYQKFL